jgi:hypothetical protein
MRIILKKVPYLEPDEKAIFTDKKEYLIFLKCKEIHNGAVAKLI